MIRIGLLLGFTAVFLQIAVFLQPLLPKQYQIAPVCETITRALFQHSTIDQTSQSQHAHHHGHIRHTTALHSADAKDVKQMSSLMEHDHHDANHQCQYCTVFGHLVLPPELSVKEILDRIQVRLIAFQKAFKHVYFVLQRLFLLPQGRAPPLFT